MYSTRWSTDLQPELLPEISGRLADAADFVRFHAVCRPWRDSSNSRARDVPTSRFLPWLLAPKASDDKDDNESVKIRNVFSKTSYRAPRSAVLYLTAGRLHDPLTVGRTLPPFPHQSDLWEKPSGTVVYADGTILLFDADSSIETFKAALLRPGDAAWTLLQRQLLCDHGLLCVAYHGGKIHVSADATMWRVITPSNDVADVLVPRTCSAAKRYSYQHGYALESRGELLWVSVHMDFGYPDDAAADGLSVSVYVLQEEETPEKYRWVSKDGRSLGDRALFLGWPNSFAVDVSPRHGGCAYFVYENSSKALEEKGRLGVFRYNLVDQRAELLEWLPKGWNNQRCTWLEPQPAIAPIQEIKDRVESTKLKQQNTSPRRIVQMLRAFFQGARLSP